MMFTPRRTALFFVILILLPFAALTAQTLGETVSDGSGGGTPLRITENQIAEGDTLVLEILSGEVRRLNLGALHKNGQWIWFSEKGLAPVKTAGESIEIEIGPYSPFASKLRSASYSDFLIALNGKRRFQPIAARARVSLRRPQGFSSDGPAAGSLHIKSLSLYAGDPEITFSLDNYATYLHKGCRIGLVVSPYDAVDGDGLLRSFTPLDLAEGISEETVAVSDFRDYDVAFGFPVGFTPRGKVFQLFVTDSEGNKLEISQPFRYAALPVPAPDREDRQQAPLFTADNQDDLVVIPRLTEPFRMVLTETVMALFTAPHTATFRFENLRGSGQPLYLALYDMAGDGEEPMIDNIPGEEVLSFFEMTLQGDGQYLFVAAPLNDGDRGREGFFRIFAP